MQAEAAWRMLGGGDGGFREPEEYATRFVPIPDARRRARLRSWYSTHSVGDKIDGEEEPDVLRAKRASCDWLVSPAEKSLSGGAALWVWVVEVVKLIEEETRPQPLSRVSRRIALLTTALTARRRWRRMSRSR